MRSYRASFRWALIALLAALSIAMQWAAPRLPVASSLDHLIADRLHRMMASDEPEHRVVVVDLDESSIAALGAWPWPRARIADLLEALIGHYGARAVGVDIVFPSAADAAGDERLAALADFAPLVLAQALYFEQGDHPVTSGKPVFDAPALSEAPRGIAATGYLANHDGFAKARCVGNIGVRLDRDGSVRRVPLMARWQDRAAPMLPVAMLACPLQRGTPVNAFNHLPQLRQDAEWELPFSRKWEAYTVIPARNVLDGSVPADWLRGRWVLVGSSALGLKDRTTTPLAATAFGVMVHAAAMTSLLDHIEGKAAALPLDGRLIAAVWTLLTLAAGAWALGRYKAWWLIPATIAGVAAWLAIASWLVLHGAVFSASAPLLAYVLVLFVISVELWMVQREQGQLLRSFATYVAPSVLKEMLRQGLENPMVPQHREITVISADMQDYTGLTNRSTLHEAAQLTREFLQCLTEPILRCEGTLDKYTGDGLVAFWGAPLANRDHTHRALEAAQAMLANVRAWNEQRVAQGLAPARVRIGVEAGSVLVGDLGTRFRRTYTAVGDCINTASKLQAIAKSLSCDLVVGPVAARLAAGSALVPVAQVQLPGYQEASVLWSFPSPNRSLPETATRQGAVAASVAG